MDAKTREKIEQIIIKKAKNDLDQYTKDNPQFMELAIAGIYNMSLDRNALSLESCAIRVLEWFGGMYAWIDHEGNTYLIGHACHDYFATYCLGFEDGIHSAEKKMARVSGARWFRDYDMADNVKYCLEYVEPEYQTPKMRIALKKHLRRFFHQKETENA